VSEVSGQVRAVRRSLSCSQSDGTLFGLAVGVQLIILLPTIGKSLKKKSYGCDIWYFYLMKIKGQLGTGWHTGRQNTNRMDSIC